jgi:hypothetical protein
MMDELIAKVDAFVEDRLTREDFELWFYDLSYDIEARHAGNTVELTHEIEAILAESSTANWTVSSLKNELDAATSKYKSLPLHRRAS